MMLQVRFSGGRRNDFGQHEYEEVLARSLERFRSRLKQVCLYVEDVNGPRGGVDKQCRCVIHLRRSPPIVIQDQDESMRTLLYRVAGRAAHTLSQQADRRKRRSQQRRGRRRPERSPERDRADAPEELASEELIFG